MRKKRKTNSGLLGVSLSYCVTLPGDSLSCNSLPPPFLLFVHTKKTALCRTVLKSEFSGWWRISFLMRKFSTLAFLVERERQAAGIRYVNVEADMEVILAVYDAYQPLAPVGPRRA